MKQYVNFLIFVIVAVVIYTAYGIMSFTKDEPTPFTFNAPVLPPELVKKDEGPEWEQEVNQQKLAVDAAQKALTGYQLAQASAPQQVSDTVSLIIDRMTSSDLPMYFLSGPNPANANLRGFQTLKIETDRSLEGGQGNATLNCSAKSPVSSLIIGTTGADTISCDATRDITDLSHDPDFIFIGGPDNDQITDGIGNRIVNGGTGDDVIKLGTGRTILILDASWGQDTVTVDCAAATINDAQIPKGFPIPWIYKTNNFIVLGKSIDPKDVVWEGNVLTNKATGDTLTVNQNCFTVVPAVK